jgi:hypothetical protein
MISKIVEYFNRRKQYKNDLAAVDTAPRLHGVNLNTWQYVGKSEISFTYVSEGVSFKEADKAYVFLFSKKDDETSRKYVLVPDSNSSYLLDKFKKHPWITNEAEMWKVCEREIYQSINDEPSKWLKEKMLEEYKCVWSNETRWWVNNDDAKYESAKKTQTKKKPKEEPLLLEDGNIVKLEFKKDKE